MPEKSHPADPNSPPKRWSSRVILERMQRFAGRLKANARWMKQFLHGGK